MSITIDQSQLRELDKVMKKVEWWGKREGENLVKEASNKFITSATVATAPTGRGKISGSSLPKKSRERPVVTIGTAKQKASRRNVYFNLKTGNILTIKKSFTPKHADKKGFVRITKFFEAINRKNGTKYYIPISPAEDKKTSKARLIPKAGATKAGWLAARAKLNAKGESGLRGVSSKVNTTRFKKGIDAFILMINNIKWLTKVSPNSARIGLDKATRALEQQFLPEAERRVKRIIK